MTSKQLLLVADTVRPVGLEILRSVANLASRDGAVVLLDADVSSGSLGERLTATLIESVPFVGRKVAAISPTRCDGCGVCLLACRLRAIHRTNSVPVVDSAICEACHSCYYQCPAHAIDMLELDTGTWTRSTWAMGPLFSGRLDPDQPDSGKLLNLMRLEARALALAAQPSTLIVAAPAGMPEVIASCLCGADLALLVIGAESDLSGLAALARLVWAAGVRAVALDCSSPGRDPLRGQVQSLCRELGLELAAAFDPPPAEPAGGLASLPCAAESLQRTWPIIRRALWTGR